MDLLIERELLVETADQLGFVVTEDEVEDEIADVTVTRLGRRTRVPAAAEGRQVQLRVLQDVRAVRAGHDAQGVHRASRRRSCWRRACATCCASGVTVSDDEVKNEFLRKNRQVNLEYMRFVRPPLRRGGRPHRGGDRRLRRQERGQAEGSLRTEEVRLREGAAAAQAAADPDQGGARRRREDRQEGARQGGRPGREDQEGRQELGQGGAHLRRGRARHRPRTRPPRHAAAMSAGGRAAAPTCRAKPRTRCSPPRKARSSARCKGNDGYVITKVEGAREGRRAVRQGEARAGRRELRREQANAKAKAAAEATLAKLKQTPAVDDEDDVPAAQRQRRGEPAATRARRRAWRRPGCSRCAPPARGR